MPQQTETVNELFVLNANSGVQPLVDMYIGRSLSLCPFVANHRVRPSIQIFVTRDIYAWSAI